MHNYNMFYAYWSGPYPIQNRNPIFWLMLHQIGHGPPLPIVTLLVPPSSIESHIPLAKGTAKDNPSPSTHLRFESDVLYPSLVHSSCVSRLREISERASRASQRLLSRFHLSRPASSEVEEEGRLPTYLDRLQKPLRSPTWTPMPCIGARQAKVTTGGLKPLLGLIFQKKKNLPSVLR
ncbi:hypothetical protein DM02DRAFT_112049 [Periconia macrospinosa]|uniref:Uncharacterized protein n=1 Tax=Periconia macrospinosa TaxID=97972 RepID=A0A2V1E6C6_9PLEO|nr:hypothetical protein DM02DRAFT_112049 [Periconia macrospinosa]